jgi:hypothetical protein
VLFFQEGVGGLSVVTSSRFLDPKLERLSQIERYGPQVFRGARCIGGGMEVVEVEGHPGDVVCGGEFERPLDRLPHGLVPPTGR